MQRIRALLAPCVVGAALVAGAPASAQALAAPSPSPSPTPLSDIGRVTTSDRQTEPVADAVRSTYVVTKADMVLHGDDNLAAALDRVPGVYIQHFGGAGATAEITIRGQRTDGILVLLDGRPVAGGGIGVIDLASMPTAGFERIEVVEGAGATLYGNGASGGVINIITSRTHTAYQTPLVQVAGGSYGYGRAALETANFSFAREIDHNDYDTPFDGLPPYSTRQNADLSSTTARFTDFGTFGDLHVSGSAGFTARILGVAGSDAFLTPAARQQDDNQDARLTLALEHPHATTTLDLSGNRETVTFLDPTDEEGAPFLDFSTDARVQASLRNTVVSDTNRLIYGVDLAHGVARNDAGNATYVATPYAQTAVYAQDSVTLGGASRFYAGVRGERDGAAGAAITPSAGVAIGIGGDFALRVNGGTSFRVPSAEDLTYPGFSNPLLLPERTQSFDATIGNAHVLGGANIGWFVQTANNLIAINPNVNYALPFGPTNEPLINVAQSSVAGFIFDAATKPFNGFVARFNATDTYRALGYQAGLTATRLADRPVFGTSLDIGYAGPSSSALDALGAVAHTVGMLTGGAGDYTTIDGYLRLRVARHALVSLRVYDLGNERYEEVAGYPMPGRTVTVELSSR